MNAKFNDPPVALNDDEVRVIPPDYTLKKIIGDDVSTDQLFNAENIEKAQQVISEHKENFLDWVMQDIAALEHSYKNANADLAASEPHIKKLARAAFVIKSQAGTFGYDLASHIAKSLDDFCNQHFKADTAHMAVIRKHIDALSLIFHKKIAGDGDTIGKELKDTLSKLVEKYRQ